MIRIKNLAFAYSKGRGVLDIPGFHAPPGLTLGLAGANGSGKSTLLALAKGLYTPDEGSITVAGLTSPGQQKAIRARVGLLMQDSEAQVLGATVGEDLELGLASDDQAGMERARGLARALGFDVLWDEPVHTLSFGEKRKLCLAAVLRDTPDLLLLDEPFSGLDYPGILEMRSLLAANREQGLTQVVAAHDLEPLADLADAWAVMHHGRLVLEGEAGKVFDNLSRFGVRPPFSWRAGLGIKPWDWDGVS